MGVGSPTTMVFVDDSDKLKLQALPTHRSAPPYLGSFELLYDIDYIEVLLLLDAILTRVPPLPPPSV